VGWDIYVERVARPATGSASDEQKIAAALPKATVCLSALAELMGNRPWLTGSAISLADLHAAPMFAVFRLAPEGERLLNRERRLADWWHRMSNRPSFARTRAALEYQFGSDEPREGGLQLFLGKAGYRMQQLV
jgi:glutathione S-transferase